MDLYERIMELGSMGYHCSQTLTSEEIRVALKDATSQIVETLQPVSQLS